MILVILIRHSIISVPISGINFHRIFVLRCPTYPCILRRSNSDLSKGGGGGERDATADRHQGLKIFSTSIIRAGALNTGIYIRRVYAHVQISRVCVYASRVHSSTYRVPWSTDVRQGEQMISLLVLLATTVDIKGRLEHQERKTHVSFRLIRSLIGF